LGGRNSHDVPLAIRALNRLERFVYNKVKHSPRVKRTVRDLYQSILDIVPTPDVKCDLRTVTRSGHFFGFHDKSAFSCGDTLLAAHKELISLRMPAPADAVEIGVFDGPDWISYRPLTTTRAWNWQQGSMLQWVGAADHLIFNDFDGQSHIARAVDARTGHEFHRLPFPIGAVSPDGRLVASYDFVRSNCGMSGYGYAQGCDPEEHRLVPEQHGLAIGDFGASKLRTLYTVADLVRVDWHGSMAGSFHWITHCQFSPRGQRMMFFHRWLKVNGQVRTRLFSCNPDGSALHLFPTLGMVSHAAWRTDCELMAYARTAKGDGYFLFRDQACDYTEIGAALLWSDGHPQFARAGRYFVTDTYPDRFRRQRLYICDMQRREICCVGVFAAPKQFVGKSSTDNYTVDLHPRWNRAGNTICFDSGHSGRRSLCTVQIPWL
jgi:hypothetical protein